MYALSRVRTGDSPARRRSYLIGDAGGLGFIDPVTAYATIKTGTALLSNLSNMFHGGAATDATRQARAQYMGQAASEGSVLAARIIHGAAANVASHEQGYWQSAAAMIPADVDAQAQQQGPFWPVGAPFDMPQQQAQIQQELAALGQRAPTSSNAGFVTSGAPTGYPSPYPTMAAGLSLGSKNLLPIALIGGGLLFAMNMKTSPARRRRRR